MQIGLLQRRGLWKNGFKSQLLKYVEKQEPKKQLGSQCEMHVSAAFSDIIVQYFMVHFLYFKLPYREEILSHIHPYYIPSQEE